VSHRTRAGDEASVAISTGRWQMAGIVVVVLLIVAFPLYRAVDATRRGTAEAERQIALEEMGKKIWSLDCAECHGITGEGDKAPALNSQQFLGAVSDEQIHRLTAVGVPGTDMPAWWNEIGGPLTDEQIAAVVAYLRSWEPTAPDRPDWRDLPSHRAGA
jgi:mono/diheme cytochrome c family protein